MKQELKSMTSKQLEKHLEDVKKALLSVRARDQRAARKAAEKAAAEFGFSLEEITSGDKPAKKPRKTKGKAAKAVSKPKYANPADKSQTWTGKGRQPNWYRAEVEKGTAPEAMSV